MTSHNMTSHNMTSHNMTSHSTTGIQWLKFSQRLTRKLTAWIEAVQSGIFMGLIDDEAFQAFDTYPFDETTLIDVTAEAELGLEPWERHVASEQLADKKSLLVVAAGGVRELIGFSQLGHEAIGIEYGQDLCNASQRELAIRQCGASIEWAKRLTVPQGEQPFEAVFVARKFLSHVHARQNRIDFLKNIRSVVNDDATLVVGFYTRDRDTLAFRLQALLANTLRRLRGKREFLIEVGDHVDPDSPLLHHHFVWEELRDELREAGFASVEHATSWFGWAVARPIVVDTEVEQDLHQHELVESY